MSEWVNIPGDLLRKINECLILYVDKVRFCCVCKSWQSELPKLPNHRQQQNQLPWLFLPSNNGNQSSHELFNMIDRKTYYLDLHNKITPGQLLRGSSYGWLFTVDNTPSMYLINPLTKVKIQLPPRSTFPDVKSYCVDDELQPYNLWDFHGPSHGFYPYDSIHVRKLMWKIILSSDPSLSNDYLVIAIYGQASRLAYCKPGDDKWTSLGDKRIFGDIIFYKEKLYGVGYNSQLMVIDDIGPNPRVTEITQTRFEHRACEVYLVASSIGLLLVGRYLNYFDSTGEPKRELYETDEFDIFKFDFDTFQWSEVTNIGDDMLFIGYSTSISMSARNFPRVKGNKIYFTDNIYLYHKEGIQGGCDIGIFDLESWKVEPLPGFKCDRDSIWPSPVWVLPSTY